MKRSGREDPLCAAGNATPVAFAVPEMASAWKKGGVIRMENMNKENQYPDAVSRSLDGGFIITLPYGGTFVPQQKKAYQQKEAYMCVGTEWEGHKPIFRIEGVNLGEDGVGLSHETVKSPVGVCEFLKGHENLTRELDNLGTVASPVNKKGEWYYYSHEYPNGVNEVCAVRLGHWGVLQLRCMKDDIFFALDNTTQED